LLPHALSLLLEAAWQPPFVAIFVGQHEKRNKASQYDDKHSGNISFLLNSYVNLNRFDAFSKPPRISQVPS
jgi:hypothetical protein